MFISCSPAEKKRALFFEFRTIIPLENHCFGDRPFLPFEVGRARAIALISLAWLKLTTWFGGGWAVDEPIFAVLNQLANVNGLKGQLINLASALTTNGAQIFTSVLTIFSVIFSRLWFSLYCYWTVCVKVCQSIRLTLHINKTTNHFLS